MFRKPKQILRSLFGKSEDLLVSKISQSHVLACRMRYANLQHNETALVDIKQVRIVSGMTGEDLPEKEDVLFFCPTEEVVVKERISPGDGQYINTNLTVGLEGIVSPKALFRKIDGTYDLENVIICANGKITVKATPKTKWVKV